MPIGWSLSTTSSAGSGDRSHRHEHGHQPQHAYDAATQALRLAEEAGGRLVIAFAGIEVGLAQRDLGEHVAAIATLTRVEQGTATLAYRPVLVMARFYLATVHRALGQYVIAARLLTDVLAEHREFGARGDEVGTLIELGTLAFDYPDAGDPQDYFRQALAIARDIGLEVPAAEALAGLDRCLHHAGDPKWRHEEAGGCDHLGEETLTIHHSGAV